MIAVVPDHAAVGCLKIGMDPLPYVGISDSDRRKIEHRRRVVDPFVVVVLERISDAVDDAVPHAVVRIERVACIKFFVDTLDDARRGIFALKGKCSISLSRCPVLRRFQRLISVRIIGCPAAALVLAGRIFSAADKTVIEPALVHRVLARE